MSGLKQIYTWTRLLFKKIEMNSEGQDIEAYKTVVILLDITKWSLSMRNDSVTPNKKKTIAMDDEESP